jgi:hypothetical protein
MLRETELEAEQEQRRGSRDLAVSSNELYLGPDYYSLLLKGRYQYDLPCEALQSAMHFNDKIIHIP